MATLGCIKGQMGTTTYYMAKLSAGELIDRVGIAKELPEWPDMTAEEKMQRECDIKRVVDEIVPYIIEDPDRFFPSLIIDIFSGFEDIEYENIAEALPNVPKAYLVPMRDMGFITLPGKERLIALDGQHHAAGDGLSIDDDGAASTGPLVAALLGAGELQPLAQGLHQRLRRRNHAELFADQKLVWLTVDGHPDGLFLHSVLLRLMVSPGMEACRRPDASAAAAHRRGCAVPPCLGRSLDLHLGYYAFTPVLSRGFAHSFPIFRQKNALYSDISAFSCCIKVVRPIYFCQGCRVTFASMERIKKSCSAVSSRSLSDASTCMVSASLLSSTGFSVTVMIAALMERAITMAM